jgi:26S proteasome regulatory subunit N9
LTLADNVKSSKATGSLPASAEGNNEIRDVEAVSAGLLARTHAAHYQLLAGQYDLVTQHIRDSEEILEKLRNVDPRLSCAFYRVAADCYKAQAAYAKFYRTSLLFLSYLEPAKMTLSPEESLVHVHSLCIAGLLSDEIYNFGELVRRAPRASLRFFFC